MYNVLLLSYCCLFNFFNHLVKVFLLLELCYGFLFDYGIKKIDHHGFVNLF